MADLIVGATGLVSLADTDFLKNQAMREGMGRMAARRLILVALMSLFSLAASGWLVAPATLAESTCPNAVSRQGPSGSLPDCRAYEQVTPVNKSDATDLFAGTLEHGVLNDGGWPADDGNEFVLGHTLASFASGGASGSSAYAFSRGAEGWTETPLVPRGLGVQNVTVAYFSPVDPLQVGVNDRIGTEANLFGGNESAFSVGNLIGPLGGPYTTVSSLSGRRGLGEERVTVMGASSDLSHVVLESSDHELAPAAEAQDAESHALYEWVGGQLRLVNLATNGSLLSPCGAVLDRGSANGVAENRGAAHGAVSSDGSKIFFTAPDPLTEGPGCWNKSASPQENPPELYMRVNGTTTVEVSAPETGVKVAPENPGNPMLPAIFVGASVDGSKVFFITRTELTQDDTTHAPELYEYNVNPGPGERALTRISRGESGTAEGSVIFVGAISADGSAVYFAASGALALGASGSSLYRYDTVTGKTTYIAPIDGGDYPIVPGISSTWYSSETLVERVGLNGGANWYTTSDGQYLVFGTTLSLTGYDNHEAPGARCENLTAVGQPDPEQCVELYRYDAQAEDSKENPIVCVSCAGGQPVSAALFARSFSGGTPSELPPRPISEDGSYVFFDSASALVSQASPGKLHVYEWHDGTISLVSSAGDPGNAYFLGSDADGRDVFFGTHAQLASADTDNSGDLYDARIDGGFVGLATPQCTGTGCQGVPASPPIFATPASVTFAGVGNLPAEPPKTKHLTRAQKLAKALKACERDRGKRKRADCKASARRRYGAAHKSIKANRRGK